MEVEKGFDRATPFAMGHSFGEAIERAIDSWKRLRDDVDSLGRSVADFGEDHAALTGDSAFLQRARHYLKPHPGPTR